MRRVELLTGRTIDFLRFVFDERVSETDHDSTLITLNSQWQVWG